MPEGSGRKPWFTKIGAAWPHKDGKGMHIELEAYPVRPRLVLFEYDEDSAKEDETKQTKLRSKK